MKKISGMDLRKNKMKLFALIILIVLVVSGLRLYYEEYFMGNVIVALGEGCGIEYGHSKCIEGLLRIPFYNPNEQDVTRMKVTVPYGAGNFGFILPADFNVDKSLEAGKTGVLNFFRCEEDIKTDMFILRWCCAEKCYETRMNRPSDKVKILE